MSEQGKEIERLEALNKELTDVLEKLDIEFIELKAELEAHKEVVRAVKKLEDTYLTSEAYIPLRLRSEVVEALEKLNKDNG